MPQLPVVSGKECSKAMERLGFLAKRQNRSHLVMRRHENVCVVPMHSGIKTGTLAGILRQAGSSRC